MTALWWARRDLRLADTLEFDPFVLPGAMPRPVAAWDDTDMVRVFEVDLTDAIIPIPGIGGGFTLEAVAELEGTYRTERIEVGDAIAPIFMENAPTVVRPDPGAAGFGAAKDTTVLPVGILGSGFVEEMERRHREQEEEAAAAVAAENEPARVEEKLKALARWREEGLIEPEQFETKRQALLDAL